MANISRSPWIGTVTLALANTVYQLSALLAALGTYSPVLGTVPKCQFLTIQADPASGISVFYLGNEGLSVTNGEVFFAGQTIPIWSMDANLIRLDHIYLMCDTAGKVLNVKFLTR